MMVYRTDLTHRKLRYATTISETAATFNLIILSELNSASFHCGHHSHSNNSNGIKELQGLTMLPARGSRIDFGRI